MTHDLAPVSSLRSAVPPRHSRSVMGTHWLRGSSLDQRRSLVTLQVPSPKLFTGLNLEGPSSRRNVVEARFNA